MRGAEPAWKIGRDACTVSCTDVVLAGGHPCAGLTAAGHCWRMARALHGASRWLAGIQLAGIRNGTDVAAQECY